MSLNRPWGLAFVVAALCVTGCARNTPPEPSTPEAATAPVVAAVPAPPEVATTLLANQWQLKLATDAAGRSIGEFFPSPDAPLGLLVEDGRLNVMGGCNRLSAGYQLLDGGKMQVVPGPSTMMACPPPLAKADEAIARFLSGTLQVAIGNEGDAPQLRLVAADGTTLTFSGTPTPETRFGGPGTRAFLEVSPQPCATPSPSAPRCLKVRDRHFDENGLASGTPGEWRDLAEGIEGYTPVANEQQVVRVKRFEQAGVAGSAPTEHFVFDMVVESRIVR